jgi:hypothetical protein
MQIEKQASLDFQAKMLLGVLLLCLCAPLFWHPSTGDFDDRNSSSFTVLVPGPRVVFPPGFEQPSFSDRRNLLPLTRPWPTQHPAAMFGTRTSPLRIEHSGRTAGSDNLAELWALMRGEPTPSSFEIIPGVDVGELSFAAGKQLAQWLNYELRVSRLLNLAADERAPSGDSQPMRSVLIRRPSDRLAMLPQRMPMGNSARVATWAVPTELLLRLENLGDSPHAAIWSLETASVVRQLTTTGQITAADRAALMTRLNELSSEAVRLADSAPTEALACELRRAHYALERRSAYWSLAQQIDPAAGLAYVAIRGDTLPNVASQPIDLRTLNSQLETYELTREPELAKAIAEQRYLLAMSTHEPHQELATKLDENYRNANIRLAISADLLERFLPEQEGPVGRSVNDRIAGAKVSGTSSVDQKLKLRLEPNPTSWNVAIDANGVIDSRTTSSSGAVRIRNQGTTTFEASKRITADSRGVSAVPASAKTHHQSRLINIGSTLDGIPLFGNYARQRGREEYRKRHGMASREVERKTASRIERQLDSQTDRLITELDQRIDQAMEPLREAGVSLDTIEMQTTDERLIARFRLASKDQLAAHTPRVRALSDSEASLQLHESALTNAAKILELDGRRLTAPQLDQLLQDKLPNAQREKRDDLSNQTVFEFAKTGAIEFHFDKGRVEMTIAFVELVHDRRASRDFKIHAYFLPETDGLDAKLVRDGVLGIEGRLRTADRARLHAVFNQILPEDRPLRLLPLDRNDPRLAGLMITQLLVEEGWLGMSIGPAAPQRTAWISPVIR